MKDEVLNYLKNTYSPRAMVVYGSFANGTESDHSDFDVMLIADNSDKKYDDSVVGGIKLDAHIFSPKEIASADLKDFVQVYDGKIVADEKGEAENLKNRVTEYIKNHTKIDEEEKSHLRNYCRKMLLRTKRGDAEGLFRRHLLICESLEFYCNMRDMFYFGPKKTLLWMKENDTQGYQLAFEAMSDQSYSALNDFIDLVIEQ